LAHSGGLISPPLDKGRGNTLIVPQQMLAHPRLHQVRKERYLFVLGDLALLVSDDLGHQSHETHLRDWVSPPMRILEDRWISGPLSLGFGRPTLGISGLPANNRFSYLVVI
jgi:hypothetical protein